jgi:hypothetical protein
MTTNTTERFIRLIRDQGHDPDHPGAEFFYTVGYLESFLQYLSATVPGVEAVIQDYNTQMEARQAEEAV